MSEYDKPFWEILANSGIEDTLEDEVDFVLEQPVTLEDIATVLQAINETASWFSHYLFLSLERGEVQVPPDLYPVMAVLQTISREVVSHLSPCSCSTCSPKPESAPE